MKKVLLVVALVLAACGGSDGDSSEGPPATAAETTVAVNTTAAPETQPSATEAPTTEAPPPAGSAAIVLTIGDETWEFGTAQCAYVGPKPGEDGSEWNVSNVKDGAQVYVSEDSFGPLVQYADISNGGNPNFNWESVAEGLDISVSGNDITVSGQFTDTVGGAGPIAGTLSATCPSWFEG